MKDIQDKTNSSSPFRGLGGPIYQSLGLFLVSLVLSFQLQAQVSFNRGVNLTGWFQTSSAQQIQFTKYTKKDFFKKCSFRSRVNRVKREAEASNENKKTKQ